MTRASGLFAAVLLFASSAPGEDRVDYLKQIKPLLKHHCVSCHGPLRRKGGLRLDAATLIHKGGDSGAAIVAGKPDDSLLLGVLTGKGGYTRMPKDGKPLKPAEMALIRNWIQQGAIAPKDEPVEKDPRAHWAFRVPKRPAVPKVKNQKEPIDFRNPWVLNPIDAFVAAEHEKRGLKPQPPAEKHILLRRVSLDLIGLPPTPKELNAFLNDKSPRAYEKVVERLLNSPRYGERWGRHWMDVWRYSDWYGYRAQLRNSARHIWRWRDYIVESLNEDKPYDKMILDMLAADENTPTDRNRLRATGYLARHYYLFNRDKWLDEAIEHTGKAFLGLTINCAKCHEHKFDPIDHRDYYEFRAIFEPYLVRTDRVPGQSDVNKDGVAIAYDAKPQAKTYIYERGNDKHPLKNDPVSPEVPDFFAGKRFKIQPVQLPPEAWYPGMRAYIRKELLAKAESAIRNCEAKLGAVGRPSKAVREIANPQGTAVKGPVTAGKPTPLTVRMAQAELLAAKSALASLKARIAADDARYAKSPPANTKSLALIASRAEKLANLHAAEAAVLRAEAGGKVKSRGKKKGAKRQAKPVNLAAARKRLDAARKALKSDDGKHSPITETYPKSSTGRRLALAKWIADKRNPLTARVAVNHVWLRHFGRPLVPTVFDFGLNGKPPSHPELLDWLAAEFVGESGKRKAESGQANRNSRPWSMKPLHRLIVTSNTYRMSSSARGAEANRKRDQDNVYLWRMNSRRMESEIVRDGVLFVAGQLDLKMGGPELDAKLGMTTNRRSIYYRHAPEKFMSFLTIFDGASTNECYRRAETVVPQQSLAMINSQLVLEQSRRLTALLNRTAKSDAEFIDQLFTRLLCRKPTAEEHTTCLAFLKTQAVRLKQPGKLSTFVGGAKVKVGPSNDLRIRARENLAHVMLNHNEFVTIR